MFISMIYSKKNAGKWVVSHKGKVIATDEKLSTVLRHKNVKKYKKKDIHLHLVPGSAIIFG